MKSSYKKGTSRSSAFNGNTMLRDFTSLKFSKSFKQFIKRDILPESSYSAPLNSHPSSHPSFPLKPEQYPE